uniref:FkbM family methyltransferase n=1 Tax=Thermofilum pendens TaxID=2269 RepID=A0A7C3SLD3_THEPE
MVGAWSILTGASRTLSLVAGFWCSSTVLVLPPYRFLVPSGELESAARNVEHVFFLKDYERLKGFRPEGVVVDVGAYLGFYSIRASRSSEIVVAVEANPLACRYLEVNLKLNSARNVKPLCSALDRVGGIRTFYVANRMINSSFLLDYVEDFSRLKVALRVPALTLKQLLEQLGMGEVDLLKVDVEGAEEEVLEGGRELFEQGVFKRVVVEIHPPYSTAKRVAELLGPRYRLLVLAEDSAPNQAFVYAERKA